jgi:hypothetical protein
MSKQQWLQLKIAAIQLSQQCRNANWLLTEEAYRKGHLSVSNATAVKIQKNLVV